MKTGVAHAENFPVASWLCPAHLRPVIAAIYWFARTADDIADEGDAPHSQRLADLAAYRNQLHLATQAASAATDTAVTAACARLLPRWQAVFAPLALHIHAHHLPVQLLHDLLSAFEQDVRRTASGQHYAHHSELLDYCRLSANPVGRLLLHLYGVTDAQRLIESDHICSALQLINFWQDLSVDLPRQRHYLPLDVLTSHGLTHADFAPSALPGSQQTHHTEMSDPLARKKSACVSQLIDAASAMMRQGSKLPLFIPGRAGWELRLVVQGGLRIANKIQRMHGRTWAQRPTLGAADVPVLLWRAWRMG